MGRSISELDISIQDRARKAFDEMNKSSKLKSLGVDEVIINEAKRSLAVQMAYYSRSRMAVADVKRMYAAAGLYTPTDQECKTANTWTLESNHIQGKAIDFAPMKNGKVWWTAPAAVWEAMGEIGETCGLKWGGRWKNKDCPHFEV